MAKRHLLHLDHLVGEMPLQPLNRVIALCQLGLHNRMSEEEQKREREIGRQPTLNKNSTEWEAIVS
jgi:hypothetical protein